MNGPGVETGVRAPMTVAAMRDRARAFLDSLSRWQRRRVTVDIADSVERSRWFYTPNPRRGVALNRLGSRQQQLALQLLASGLSEAGFTAVNIAMSLETLLDRDEGWGPRTTRGGRDPLRYTVALFGDPDGQAWGWRFEGHHLSVRYLVRGDSVSCTPLFLGGHPARSPLPDGGCLDSPLVPAQRAVELLRLLSTDDAERAVISPVAPIDIVTSNRSVVAAGSRPRTPGEMIFGLLNDEWARWQTDLRNELQLDEERDRILELPAEPDGVTIDAIAPEAQDRFRRLIDYYVGLVPREVADGYRERIAAADSPRFAWAGATDVESASYFRIRNQRLLIEFDNAQDHANHVHAVWRDPVSDFGRELLGEPSVEVVHRFPTLPERIVRRLARTFD